ncbi:hypothetical protein H4582DRAFT_2058250 [Lactarius indigo]|nr:hypothetical protein H4582DRAFT_2058250 [Lactarius indigo]
MSVAWILGARTRSFNWRGAPGPHFCDLGASAGEGAGHPARCLFVERACSSPNTEIITIEGFRGDVLMARKRLATPWILHHPADPGLSEPFKSSRDNVAAGVVLLSERENASSGNLKSLRVARSVVSRHTNNVPIWGDHTAATILLRK